MRIPALAALLYAFTALAQSTPLDIKGVPFGASEVVIKKTFDKVYCSDNRVKTSGDRLCYALSNTYAGAPADFFFDLYGDSMQSAMIYIKPLDHFNIVDALTQRLGTPSVTTTEQLKTRMGAVFQNVLVKWIVGDITIEAEKYGGSIDKGRIRFTTQMSREESARRRELARPERAKDL